MAQKPRVKAPKQRSAGAAGADRRNRLLLLAGGGGVALAVLGAILFAAVGRGGGSTDTSSVRAHLQAAGCTLQTVKAEKGVHSILSPGGISKKWNTDPPTNGPHYAV